MATGSLYRFEDSFIESKRAQLLDKLAFDELPPDLLKWILDSKDTTGDDHWISSSEDELISSMGIDDQQEQWWATDEVETIGVDRFVNYFVRSSLFRGTVKKLIDSIFNPTKMDVLQLADGGEELLSCIEECDNLDHYDILKLRKVELVKSTQETTTISSKYSASFTFADDSSINSKRHLNTYYNTGCLFLSFANLGELGNEGEINTTTQNKIPLANASYEIGVNGDLPTWEGKLRFVKNILLTVLVDTKFLWKCMIEEPDHPFYKECHPLRSGGGLQTNVFLAKYAQRFSMRHSSQTTEKQMLPKIRLSKKSLKHYLKFKLSVVRKLGAKEMMSNRVENVKKIKDPEKKTIVQNELQLMGQKTYRYFNVYLHGILGGKRLSDERRGKLGYGDIIRFSVSTTCYSDSQKNVFTILHSPSGSSEVVLRKMYLRNTECEEPAKVPVSLRMQQIAYQNMMGNEGEDEEEDNCADFFSTEETNNKRALTRNEDSNDEGDSNKRSKLALSDKPFNYKY